MSKSNCNGSSLEIVLIHQNLECCESYTVCPLFFDRVLWNMLKGPKKFAREVWGEKN